MASEKVREIVHIRSNSCSGCRLCRTSFATSDEDDWFEKQVNHYLGHGCKLLYVGGEDRLSEDGNPWTVTVATIGILASQ